MSKILFYSLKVIFSIFFNHKHIRGKHFEGSLRGWFWLLKGVWFQKILGFNRFAPYPMSYSTKVTRYKNLYFDADDLNNLQSPGCYFQNAYAKIIIGKGSYIAPNVGLITTNHDPGNLDIHLPGEDIIIGERCWIGMNSVILPGVTLGKRTVVAAGAVVTKSFVEGNCLVGGVPAKVIKYYGEK